MLTRTSETEAQAPTTCPTPQGHYLYTYDIRHTCTHTHARRRAPAYIHTHTHMREETCTCIHFEGHTNRETIIYQAHHEKVSSFIPQNRRRDTAPSPKAPPNTHTLLVLWSWQAAGGTGSHQRLYLRREMRQRTRCRERKAQGPRPGRRRAGAAQRPTG